MKKRVTSFLGILGIIFVVLKLAALVSWSWWIVLLPFILIIIGPILGRILISIVGSLFGNFR